MKKPTHRRKGNGSKPNYDSYCQFCKVEFLIPMEICEDCKAPTHKSAQRVAELTKLVEDFKERRKKKKEKLEKWKLWKKTNESVKSDRYNMEQYQKWEYFTDEEDEDEELLKSAAQTPNDPKFRALEIDLEKRHKKKKEENNQSQKLKAQGNKYFKAGKLALAEKMYNEGIEKDKCNKALWLNRALIRIKLGKFEAAAEDCTKMLEYMEFLEDGFTRSFKWAVKAFLRRAKSYMLLQKFDEARNDLDKLENVISEQQNETFTFTSETKEVTELRHEIEKRAEVDQIVKQTIKAQEPEAQESNYFFLTINL